MSKARLRTKSGCLTCRRRKVKCGEERPFCTNCSIASRLCKWPTQDSFVDGRSRRRASQGSSTSSLTPDGKRSVKGDGEDVLDGDETDAWPICSIPLQTTIRTEMDNDLVLHFHDSMSVLLLSTAHQGFHEDFRWRILNIGLTCEGVKNAILAWSASNKYMRSNDIRYRQAAIGYYSQAVSAVKEGMLKLDSSASKRLDDTMMIAVEYLYLQSLWGSDNGVDARTHVAGAMNLMRLRYSDASDMVRPFDRVLVESVLYQAFLLHMRFPFTPNFHVDDEFLRQTKALLDYLGFEDACAAGNSPVLGLPLGLYQLILNIITFFGSTDDTIDLTLDQLQAEMRYWEQCLVAADVAGLDNPLKDNPHSKIIELYILTTSLMLDLMIESHTAHRTCSGSQRNDFSTKYWQVSKVLAMFSEPADYERWTRCYIALWPMLMIGYAIEDEDEIELLKRILDDMRQEMGYGEVQRVHDELDLLWTVKQFPSKASRQHGHNFCNNESNSDGYQHLIVLNSGFEDHSPTYIL